MGLLALFVGLVTIKQFKMWECWCLFRLCLFLKN
jgi:hypothetical protein